MAVVQHKSEAEAPRRLGRRQFVAGGALGVASLLAAAERAEAAADTSGWLVYKSTGPDGASVRYPPAWTLDPGTTRDLSLDPYLVYPHQSFALRTTTLKPPDDVSTPDASGLPNLTGYPSDAAIIWLMYYDEIVEGTRFAGLGLGSLEQRTPAEFTSFGSYVARFSNAARSFLLKTWVGRGTTGDTVSAVDACLKSIAVP